MREVSSTLNTINLSTQATMPYVLLGIIAGAAVTLLARRSIVNIMKHISIVVAILLSIIFVSLFFVSNNSINISHFDVSISCIFSYLSVSAIAIVNLPTIFKLARSKYDAKLSLTAFICITIFIQIASLLLYKDATSLFTNQLTITYTLLSALAVLCFVLFALNSCLAALFLAYPSMKLYFSTIARQKALVIFALASTILYSLISISSEGQNLILLGSTLTTSFILNLGWTLLIMSFIRALVTHRPLSLEKPISIGSWLIGCIASTYACIWHAGNPFMIGSLFVIASYFIAFFIEEPYWSYSELKKQNKK